MFKSSFLESLSKKYYNSFLLVFGVSILGVSDNILLMLSENIGLAQFHFLRSVISICFIIFLSRLTGLSIKYKNLKAVLIRSIFIVISMVIFFGTLPVVSAAGAGAGLFTSPIFVVCFSLIFLKIIPNIFNILAIIVGSFGIWLVLNPWSEGFNFINFFPILAGAFYAAGVMITKNLCANEPPLALLTMFFMVIGSLGLVFSISAENIFHDSKDMDFILRGWREVSLNQIYIISLMSFLTIIGIWMMTIAYQAEDTSYLAPYEYTYLISASFFGWLFWENTISIKMIMGMLLIFLAGAIISKSKA